MEYKKIKFTIPKNSRFALVGHGYHLNYLYNLFIKNKLFKPIIITHKKKFHSRDIKEGSIDENLYKNIFKLKKETKVIELDDINSINSFKILKKNKITHIFSCSSRFIFKKKIVNKFKNKIFNIHPTHLPLERGGGIFTYRIMNVELFCCATIHLINTGIDSGDIILKSKRFLVKKNSVPYDYLLNTNKSYAYLLKKFIFCIKNHKTLIRTKQIEKKKSYLTRFYTDVMGAIDWSWEGKHIDSFIKACSKPYSGAFTSILFKKKLIKIKIFFSKFKKTKKTNHPYLWGKIFYEHNGLIKVLVKDGILLIKLINIRGYKTKMKFEGKTFFNNPYTLLVSKISQTNIFKYKN